jgi:ATP-dependent Lon protease
MTNQEHHEYDDTLPVLPVRTAVPLPRVLAPLEVGRPGSIAAVDAATAAEGYILAVPQRDPAQPAPLVADLHEVGVVGKVTQVMKQDSGRYTVVLQCVERASVDEWLTSKSYLEARVTPLATVVPDDDETLNTLAIRVKRHLAAIVSDTAEDPEEAHQDVMDLDDPDDLADIAASHVDLPREQQVALLLETNPEVRLSTVLPVVQRLHEVLTMKADIGAKLEDETSRAERERVLRERKRAIQEELGEADDSDLDDYLDRIETTDMPDEARQAARRQVNRMRQMSSASPEYTVSRTYLETLLEIPWGIFTEDTLDVPAARAILDADHSGLDKVKKRILEFIAVRKLAPDRQGPILCLVGPPGVGKTSLGRSISSALARKYVRVSLGGVRDESEIRGHRRTYIGALPGRIATGLKKAGAMNPVFVLDEIDKLGSSHRGDPSSAMLEVLDPAQNDTFVDHYLEVELDLSKVMFIATANTTETIPGPLLDRLEIIHIPGYTENEKKLIATKHLLPKQMVEHGLGKDQLDLDPDALAELVLHYTREAGVRNLEREIAAVCRYAAVEVAGAGVDRVVVDTGKLDAILGPPKFHSELADQPSQVGVSTGLAWTPVGGDILFVEVRTMPGKGDFKLTGQIGDVMRESALAALSWVRANAERLDIDPAVIAANDLHIHVPAGAVRKDGPSAGVAIATALVSRLKNRPVHSHVAMTGELTLRGRILPVGGIKEKVLAAHRSGIKTVILPERNDKDLEEIPKVIRDDLEIHLASKVDEALDIALGPASDADAPPMPPPPGQGTRSTTVSVV